MLIENLGIPLSVDSIYSSIRTTSIGGFIGKVVAYGQANPLILVVVSVALIIFYRYYCASSTSQEKKPVVEENKGKKPWYDGLPNAEYEELRDNLSDIPGSGVFPPKEEKIRVSKKIEKNEGKSSNDSSDSDRSPSPQRVVEKVSRINRTL